MTGWIGVDLDGTLAQFDRWRGPDSIGLPIPAMVKRVQAWIAEGREVRIFTARATDPRLIPPIKRWLKLHGLPDLKITNVKDFQMIELWDDRAVQVIHNTGRAVQPKTLDEQEKPELIDVENNAAAGDADQAIPETVLEPTKEEVEAFKQAVKSRATKLDDSLLDALDAGYDYTPEKPSSPVEAHRTAVTLAASAVASVDPEPAQEVETELDLDLNFPSVNGAIRITPTPAAEPELGAPQPAEPVVTKERSPFEEEPESFAPPTEPHIPSRATRFPALNVDDDDWDTGLPSLRIDNR